jgi:hypothetical protein
MSVLVFLVDPRSTLSEMHIKVADVVSCSGLCSLAISPLPWNLAVLETDIGFLAGLPHPVCSTGTKLVHSIAVRSPSGHGAIKESSLRVGPGRDTPFTEGIAKVCHNLVRRSSL